MLIQSVIKKLQFSVFFNFFKKNVRARIQKWENGAFVLGDKTRRIQINKVNVIYWKGTSGHNVGDLLSKIVIEKVAELKQINIDSNVGKTIQLLGIGSIIQSVKVPSVVWGSGLISGNAFVPSVSLDIRAVRGPLTRQKLIDNGHDCPEVYGDPAILCPRIFNFDKFEKIHPYTVIPHFSKEHKYIGCGVNVLSTITSDWKGFIEVILKSKLIISGSLHGIILAESFGVPALMLDDCDKEDKFKYLDYYYSTNRKEIKLLKSIDDGLSIEPPAVPDLSEMAIKLLSVFPVDIWREKC